MSVCTPGSCLQVVNVEPPAYVGNDPNLRALFMFYQEQLARLAQGLDERMLGMEINGRITGAPTSSKHPWEEIEFKSDGTIQVKTYNARTSSSPGFSGAYEENGITTDLTGTRGRVMLTPDPSGNGWSATFRSSKGTTVSHGNWDVDVTYGFTGSSGTNSVILDSGNWKGCFIEFQNYSATPADDTQATGPSSTQLYHVGYAVASDITIASEANKWKVEVLTSNGNLRLKADNPASAFSLQFCARKSVRRSLVTPGGTL